MEVFKKIVNGFSFLTIFAKSSILDVWQDPEQPFKPKKDLRKKSHLRCVDFGYLFTKFDSHIPPNLLQDSIVHGQMHVTLISTYLFNNENYNSVS